MKKLIALLCAVCAAAMSLCVACASPLTGDTSNMGLWITLVVVAVIAVVVLLIVGKRRKINSVQTAPGQWPGAVFIYFACLFYPYMVYFSCISVKRKILEKERTT